MVEKKHSFSDPSLFCFVKPDLVLSDVGALENKKKRKGLSENVSLMYVFSSYMYMNLFKKVENKQNFPAFLPLQ